MQTRNLKTTKTKSTETIIGFLVNYPHKKKPLPDC